MSEPGSMMWKMVPYGDAQRLVAEGLALETNLPWKLIPYKKPAGRIWLDAQPYRLWNRFDTLVFAKDEPHAEEFLYFLYEPLRPNQGLKRFPKERLKRALEENAYGRCITFRPGGKYWLTNVYLFFHADGTGRYHDDQVAFDFIWSEAHLNDGEPDLWDNPGEALRDLPVRGNEAFWEALCSELLIRQIEPRQTDPFVDVSELKNIPMEFLRGSEEALKSVTRWMLHTRPALFELLPTWTITYEAQVGEKPGGVQNTPDHYDQEQMKAWRKVKKRLALVFEQNAFIGTRWQYRGGGSRRSRWAEEPVEISLTVTTPSAHERAEALYELDTWLEGKVAESKEEEYPLPARAEIER